jgi:uncharacterized membrane protein
MIEFHPAIVHFPIALLSIAALFAVISLFRKKDFFREVAFWNLLLGVIGAIAAALTGLIDEQNLTHNEEIHKILVKHKFTGFSILILSFALLTWLWVRKNKLGKSEYILWVLFLVLGTAMVSYQGYLGGRMVFEQGAGVKPMEHLMEKEGDSTSAHSHSNSTHDHDNVQDTSASKKAIPEKTQHVHSSSTGATNQLDTSKRQENKEVKDKKKELKDMKY